MATQVALLVARLVADTSQFERSMTRSNAIMGGLSKAAVGLGAATGVGMAVSIAHAMDYERSLVTLKSVTGANAQQMKALSAQAFGLADAQDTANVSARDGIKAQIELGKAGLTPLQVMKALHPALNLATAAELDQADATSTLVRNIKAFGLNIDQARRVSDIFVNTMNKSTADATDLTQATQQASSAFAQAKMPIQDMYTALGILADRGIKGSDAGTSLKTMLARLNPTTKQAAEMIDKYNLSAFDAHGNMLSMREITEKYTRNLAGLTTQERQHALQAIFGSDAIRGASNVLLGGTRRWDSYHKAITKSGTAQDLARKRAQSSANAFNRLKTQLDNASVALGQALLPAASAVAGILSKVVGFTKSHTTTTKVLVSTVLGLTAALLAIVGVYKAWNLVKQASIILLGEERVATLGLRIQLAALAIWQRVVTTAQWLWNAALLANPIGLVVVAIAALVAGLVLLYVKFKPFHELVDGVWDRMKSFAGWIKSHWKDVVLGIVAPWLLVVKKADDAFGLHQKLIGALTAILSKIKSWGASVINFLSSLPGKFLDWGTRMGNHLKDGITGAVTGLGSALSRIVKNAINGVISLWNRLDIPGFTVPGPGPLPDIHVPGVSLPDISYLARGGIVTGPRLAVIGDNPSHREAVVPLPDRGGTWGGGDTYNIQVKVEGAVLSQSKLEDVLLDTLTRYGRRNGRVRLVPGSGPNFGASRS